MNSQSCRTRENKIMAVLINICCLLVLVLPVTFAGTISRQEFDVMRHLKKINKPAVKSIKSPDGDIIDCVHISHQPAFDHPLLKNHTIQMAPSNYPQRIYSHGKASSSFDSKLKPVAQLWHLNGRCPEGTIPIRRTTKEDVMRASSVQRYGKKNIQSVPKPNSVHSNQISQFAHEHAVRYVEGDKYYGAKARINVWNPKLEQSHEFSLAQIWVTGGSFREEDLNTIEAGWQVYPTLNGDNNTRFFIYWTSDAYKRTGCYNLLCPGFIQINKEIALGEILHPISKYAATQYDISILVWKDPKKGNWWLKYNDKYVLGYWPGNLFPYLADSATDIEWGGEIINSQTDGRRTSTQMGSGHFPNEGFRKASYFRNLEVVDGSNKIRDPQGLSTFITKPYCYDLRSGKASNYGHYFYYGGPGRNPNCP